MARPPEILVCFAVNEEARPFFNRATPLSGTRIAVTGMGRRNAEQAVRTAVGSSPPQWVVTAGFAGGLNPNLACGTVLFEADPETSLRVALSRAGAVEARFHCADRVAVTAEEKRQLRALTGADAVEMESGAIRSVCRRLGLSTATVRVILDTANEDLPLDFNQLMTADMRIDSFKLARAILRSPSRISALRRFQKRSQEAARSLAETLRRALGTLLTVQSP
jgi:adenosylhomocysteine nucleosidase